MRKLLLLAVLLIPVIAFSAEKRMPAGKWKEVKRMGTDNTVLSYKDTIRIEFKIGNEYIWQKQGGFIYKGTYKLGDKDLDLGMRDFTIVEKKPEKLVVKDETGTYEFVPDRSVAAQPGVIPAEAKPAPVGSINQMVGHWSVYKATSANTQNQIDYTRKIKMIDITGGSSDGKLGYVYSTHDADNTPSWTIDSYDNQILHCGGKDARTLKVLKCQDNDLVIEEDNMTYFFRQFK